MRNIWLETGREWEGEMNEKIFGKKGETFEAVKSIF